MTNRAAFAVVAGAALLLASPLALTQPQAAPAEISIKDVIAKLESLGYREIGEIEKDDGRWEIEAVTADGRRVELDVDPRDGSIVRERPDDDD